ARRSATARHSRQAAGERERGKGGEGAGRAPAPASTRVGVPRSPLLPFPLFRSSPAPGASYRCTVMIVCRVTPPWVPLTVTRVVCAGGVVEYDTCTTWLPGEKMTVEGTE